MKLVKISTMHPRANGLIERYNREVKAGLRRIITMCPRAQWYEALPDVIRGLRILPTTTTGFSPFQLTFKQEPALPIQIITSARQMEECPFTMESKAAEVLH